MGCGRDCSLPDGVKDLLEMIHLHEKAETEYRQQLLQLKSLLAKGDLVLRILGELRRRIDQDLLFTEEYVLVHPNLYQVTYEEWDRVLQDHPLAVTERTYYAVVDITVEILWALICTSRSRYLETRDEGGRLDF